MKYKLIIDKDAEEEVSIRAHAPSSLTKEIENLVRSYSGRDGIMGYSPIALEKNAIGALRKNIVS